MAKKKKPNQKMQAWIDARKRHRLSHAQIQMARELGMNPKKLGKKDNHDQEPWKMKDRNSLFGGRGDFTIHLLSSCLRSTTCSPLARNLKYRWHSTQAGLRCKQAKSLGIVPKCPFFPESTPTAPCPAGNPV